MPDPVSILLKATPEPKIQRQCLLQKGAEGVETGKTGA